MFVQLTIVHIASLRIRKLAHPAIEIKFSLSSVYLVSIYNTKNEGLVKLFIQPVINAN